MMTVFCSSIGNAQIIYSNNFSLGAANVDITNTSPTVANSYAGGTNTTFWLDVLGTGEPVNPGLFANGLDNSTSPGGNSWILPFKPTNNSYIYLLNVTVTFTNNPGNWVGAGFAQAYGHQGAGLERFSDTVAGIDWEIITEASGNVQGWGGAKTANAFGTGLNNFFTAGPGTHTMSLVLNTETTLWGAAAYVDGEQFGSYVNYTANPTIQAVGITQNVMTAPNSIQWNNLALVTTLQPFIVQQPTPAQITLGGGAMYTNIVKVLADTNGGPLVYQWYANNTPLTNGVNNVVSGANSNLLVINPIESANQFTNYYVTVSNNFGSFTSSFASVTVLTNPVITAPTVLSNAITLFTGSGSVVGSSPTFSVTAVGAPPLSYRWLTNGAVVTGATNSSISFTNLQSGSVASYTCIVSNGFGTTNAAWYPTYTPAPTAAYPQAVLGDIPLEFWRLNEASGVISYDYNSGNNGVYTNVTLGQTGYDTSEPAETSIFVTASGNQPSMVGQMGNLDLAQTMSSGVNAEFTVEGWSTCVSGNGATGGAPVVSQGTFGASSFFLGVDTNATTKHYQFYVRNAAGTLFSADDSVVSAQDQNWHYLVGVCDEANSNVSLYIDGRLAASAVVPTNSGLFESGMPIAIGAGIRSGSATYNVPFTGLLDDVAIYKHALPYGQVINHFVDAGGMVPVAFAPPLPPANFPYLANQTLTIPATVGGSGPLGYYWTNVTIGGAVLASGAIANSGSLNATLAIPNASAGLSGDQLELVVTNSFSSTNTFVTLFNPPPGVALDATNAILYSNLFNGGTWSIAGMPLTAANVLVGGTNSKWADALGTNDTGGSIQASGIPGTAQADAWLLPFTPHSGYIYTLSAALTFTGSPGNWVGLGFTQIIPTNAAGGRFADSPNTAYDWQILTESSGNVQYFAGANGNGTVISANTYFTNNVGPHTEQIVLDATGSQWKYYSVVDGKISATNTYGSGVPSGALSTNPPIGAVGFEQNAMTLGSQNLVQWDSFTLTQVAPGGVPPYLLNPLPPTNSIVLSNATVAISATAFGSAPFGYRWINNSSVIASGSTGSMEPLSAGLSVSSSSLSPGTLQLVVTNAYGTNITSITLVSPVNPNPGHIQFSTGASQLTLSWPTNLGWTLQAQSNAPGVGLTTNWVNVPNSSTTNQVTVPITSTNGSVFYRLILP